MRATGECARAHRPVCGFLRFPDGSDASQGNVIGPTLQLMPLCPNPASVSPGRVPETSDSCSGI